MNKTQIDRLKQARLQIGMNQEETAKTSGLTQKDISLLESGKKKFIPPEYIHFLYKNGTDLNWLFGGASKKSEVSMVLEPHVDYQPLVLTIDKAGEDNILLVPYKAQAGYLRGIRDQEYVGKLPTFNLPKYRNGIYRAFEVDGYSMLTEQGIGLHPTDYVVGRFVEHVSDIRDNNVYVIVNNAPSADDIIIKRCYKTIEAHGWLLCKSDRKTGEYPDIHLDPKHIKEIWEWKGLITAYYPNVNDLYERMNQLEIEVSYLHKQLKS